MTRADGSRPTEGRPKITPADFHPDWKEQLYELATEGASIIELAVKLDIGKELFYRLSREDEEFSNVIKRCRALSEDWWQKQGRKNLQNKEFNYTGWYMNMKNRFGWRDKRDITTKGEKLPTPILGGNRINED